MQEEGLSKAMQVLDRMRENGVDPDVFTYGTLLSACDKANAWEVALRLLDEMQENAPNVVCYTAVISACNKGRREDISEELWRQMLLDGIQPNNNAYSAIMASASNTED
ncbi:unnamed protein product, partial [Discosporangium mesarthrocarpum]